MEASKTKTSTVWEHFVLNSKRQVASRTVCKADLGGHGSPFSVLHHLKRKLTHTLEEEVLILASQLTNVNTKSFYFMS